MGSVVIARLVAAQNHGFRPNAAFWVAAVALALVLIAAAIVLSPAGEPRVPRHGSVQRALDRREAPEQSSQEES